MGVIKGHNVTLIAESSTTRTEWSLIDNGASNRMRKEQTNENQ